MSDGQPPQQIPQPGEGNSSSPNAQPRAESSPAPRQASIDARADDVLNRAAEQTRKLDASRQIPRLSMAGTIPQLSADERDRRYQAAMKAERQAEARRQQMRAAEFWQSSDVPPRYRSADINDLSGVPDDVRERYAAAVDGLRGLLSRPAIAALIGPRGPGKTWMACAMVREFCRAGRRARYTTAMGYIQRVRDTWDARTGQTQAQVERIYAAQELIVIDEYQDRGGTASEDLLITRLIDARYSACLSTIMIANLTEADFMARVGTSIADRLYDDGGGLIECDWPSLRGRIGGTAAA